MTNLVLPLNTLFQQPGATSFAVSSICMGGSVSAACAWMCSVCVCVVVMGSCKHLIWYLLLIWVLIIPQKLLIIIARVTQLSLHLRNTYMCLCYSMFVCNECLLTFFCFFVGCNCVCLYVFAPPHTSCGNPRKQQFYVCLCVTIGTLFLYMIIMYLHSIMYCNMIHRRIKEKSMLAL